MKLQSISRRSLLVAAAGAPLAHGLAMAQDNSPLEWVVGYPPGGGSDIVARLVAEQMAKTLGRPVIVNNKPGAGTTIAAQYVATARTPMLFSADFATLAASPSLFAKLSYDPEKDFAPVGMLARAPMLLVVSPQVPATNFRECLAWAKSQPAGVNFASAGVGSPHHLVGEQVKDLIGIRMNHIAYRGAGPALNDLMGGQVPMAMMDLGSAYQFVSAGKIRALASATLQRVKILPEVPTFDELGYKGFAAYAWQSVVASNATPADLRVKLNAALNAALNVTQVKARLQVFGVEGLPGPAGDLMPYAKDERARWGAVIRKNNIRID